MNFAFIFLIMGYINLNLLPVCVEWIVDEKAFVMHGDNAVEFKWKCSPPMPILPLKAHFVLLQLWTMPHIHFLGPRGKLTQRHPSCPKYSHAHREERRWQHMVCCALSTRDSLKSSIASGSLLSLGVSAFPSTSVLVGLWTVKGGKRILSYWSS